MKKQILAVCAIGILIAGGYAVQVHAQPSQGGKAAAENPNATQGGKVPPEKSTPSQGLKIRLNNPLNEITTIPQAISKIMSIVVRIAIPIIIIAFIWTGLKFILAQGNDKDLGTAKNMFFYTVIGTLLILGAWTITNAIVGTVNTIVK